MDMEGEGGNMAIRLRDVSIGYNGKALFDPITLSVPKATVTVIIGANGSGKSTLLHTISGNIRPISGIIEICNSDIATIGNRQLAKIVSLVYTDKLVTGGLTVGELVSMGRYPYTGFLCRLSSEDKKIVDESMAAVGIIGKKDCYLANISDGERQKAMIARALAQQTPILLLDEPTNFLDVASRLEILDLIARLVKEKQITVLLSTHDITAAMEMTDNVITVIPDNRMPVSIDAKNSKNSMQRMEKVFADRGIVFDHKDYVFRLNSSK